MRFSVTPSPRVRFSVECVFPHLGKRGATSRKSAVCTPTVTQSASFRESPPQSALFRRMRLSSPGQTWRRLTEKRILQPAPHGKAHSARQQSPRVRLFVRVRPRVRFSVECAFPHLRKRGAASRKSALCADGLTEKRILQPASHGKAQSATAARPQRDGKAQSAHNVSRKAHSAIPRRPSYVFL